MLDKAGVPAKPDVNANKNIAKRERMNLSKQFHRVNAVIDNAIQVNDTKMIYVAFLVAGLIMLSGSAYAAGVQVPKSFSGTFAGANPTITVGGNCPPLSARIDITGGCGGENWASGGCGSIPSVSGALGYYLNASASPSCGYSRRNGLYCGIDFSVWGSFATGESCSNSANSRERCDSCGCAVDSYFSCTATSFLNQEGKAFSVGNSNCASTGCSSTVYYTPCSQSPQAAVNGGTWKYSGLVKNTSTVSIPIGTNSNPPSSPSGYIGLKIPVGNLQPGGNLPALSALGHNGFNYTVYWTEETVTASGDIDGDGYYITSCTLGNDCNDLDPSVNPGRAEVPGNGKDDNCDGYVDTLFINSMTDIAANCPYDPLTRTYFCITGWNNIYVQNDIRLPTDCTYDRSSRCGDYLVGCDARNIIFRASNDFSAKNIYTNAAGRTGGSIAIEAKKITAISLNTYGSLCSSADCSCDTPRCGTNSGGSITLKADMISINSLNANDGLGGGGSGGNIKITANSTNIASISSSGSGYSCSVSGYGNGAGSGGNILIKSKTASISSISANGGDNDYRALGGSGGSLKLVADVLTLGDVSANGARGGGSGGSARIYTDTYTLDSITENSGGANDAYGIGPGGLIAFFTDGILPQKGEYYGGTATLDSFSPPSGKSVGCDSYYDPVKHGTAWKWPILTGYTICDRGGMCATYDSGGWYKACYSTGGYTCAGKLGCCSPSNPYYNPSDGKCYQIHTILNAATIKTEKRTLPGFFVFETNMTSGAYNSYSLRIRDATTGAAVKNIYGTNYSQDGSIFGKYVKAFVGMVVKLKLKLGNDYQLVLSASSDSMYNSTRCGAGASCQDYIVPFIEW